MKRKRDRERYKEEIQRKKEERYIVEMKIQGRRHKEEDERYGKEKKKRRMKASWRDRKTRII